VLGAKLRLLLGLTLGICLPYFWLQRARLGVPFEPPATPLDAAIPFAPRWVWAYSSLYVLVPLSALCCETRAQVAAYARGLVWMCLPCFAFFALLPSASPRLALAAREVELGWLVAVDTPWNAFPSLHAALTVFCLGHLRRVIGEPLAGLHRTLFDAGALAWGAAILLGALATKQHWVVDLVAGGALGALALARSARP
jgi:membrane-associated phospholipid phosphatase